ncbi:MAG: cell division protein FtsQ/DivIB [Vagococcus sp.]
MTNDKEQPGNKNESNDLTVTSVNKENQRENGQISTGIRDDSKEDNTSIEQGPFQPFSVKTLKRRQTPEEKELLKRLTIILGTLAVATLITLYFISPFSKVDKIVLSGINASDPEQIVEASNIQIGDGIWPRVMKQKRITKEIEKQNPRVESANLHLINFNQFKITIREYPTIAYVEKDKKKFEILSNGVILKEVVTTPSDKLPILINFKEGENLTEFLKAYAKFDSELKENITEIESIATKTNPFRIKFKMKDGNEVIALSTTVADKMVFYSKIVNEMKDKGVVDMEAGTSGVFSYPFESSDTINSDDGTEIKEQGFY